MNQIQFQLRPPHKAKTYYKIGNNIIIIQSWWAGFCLMKPVNLYHPATIFTLRSCFAPAFWSLAIWHKAATEIENSAILSGVCSWRLLIHLDRIHCLVQRALCVTCMLRIKKKKWCDESLDCHRFRKLVCCGATKALSVAHNCFRPTTFTAHIHKHKEQTYKKGVWLRLEAYTGVFHDLKGGLLQSFFLIKRWECVSSVFINWGSFQGSLIKFLISLQQKHLTNSPHL